MKFLLGRAKWISRLLSGDANAGSFAEMWLHPAEKGVGSVEVKKMAYN